MTNQNVTILVVDDEPPIRKLLRVGLGSQGYAVSEAPNAKVAIELVGTEKPDLILLDLGLPGMTGHE
ncbi:MAG: response regulator, partial [Mesorhizobium sp.]